MKEKVRERENYRKNFMQRQDVFLESKKEKKMMKISSRLDFEILKESFIKMLMAFKKGCNAYDPYFLIPVISHSTKKSKKIILGGFKSKVLL